MTKRTALIAFILSVMVLPFAAYAQSSDTQRSRWMEEMRKYKFDFFTKELSLDKEQQSQFLPLYEEMEKEIFKVNNDADNQIKKIAAQSEATDAEYKAAALAASKAKLREGEIQVEYFSKFEKILSAKQLFQLKQAEDKFTKELLNLRKRKHQ